LFISVMILGSGLIALLQKLLTFTGLRLIDRLLGGVFGLARGVLVLMVVIYFAEPFVGTRQFWVESLAIARAQEAMAIAAEYLQPVAASQERAR
jgi:membrane protein required for colicin V production